MFFERAKEKDQKTTTPGVRKFFLDDDSKRLFAEGLTERLGDILTLFEFINKGIVSDDEKWMSDVGICQSVDILKSYSNEFWKYPVIVFYLRYHNQVDFATTFGLFLKRLIACLMLRYFEMPTISAVKGDILKLNVAAVESSKPAFPPVEINREKLRPNVIEPHSKIVRMILKLVAYEKQTELLPKSWDIEHILPQKWENGYFPNVNDEVVRQTIEHIGNKVPFETVKNIKASNGFFAKKQELYRTSSIAVVRELCNCTRWGLAEIGIRDVHISDRIMDKLVAWIREYD